MVVFTYSVDHGTAKKGEDREMYKSTAEALATAGIGEITTDEPVEEVETDVVETRKPGPISTTGKVK